MARRTIVFCTGSSTSLMPPPPETWIHDRNLEKAGYRILVLYNFSFSFFFIFLVSLFLYLSISFLLFFLFPFSSTPTPTSSPLLPYLHSHPPPPNHILPEARSLRCTTSHPPSRPRPP